MIKRAPSFASSDSVSRGLSPTPSAQHLIDPSFDLRRRRYRTSHGVRPPSIVFAGLEGTYAVACDSTRRDWTALLRRDRHGACVGALGVKQQRVRALPGASWPSARQSTTAPIASTAAYRRAHERNGDARDQARGRRRVIAMPRSGSSARSPGRRSRRRRRARRVGARRRQPCWRVPRWDSTAGKAKSARTLAITSRTRSVARWRSGAHPRRDAKDMGQAVDRDHQNVVLDALDAPRTDEAHDAKGAVACPPSPAS